MEPYHISKINWNELAKWIIEPYLNIFFWTASLVDIDFTEILWFFQFRTEPDRNQTDSEAD